MQPEFWHARWREGRTGFHQPKVSGILQKEWPSLGLAPASRVFVPLCGKSLDMAWLARAGHTVLGAELSDIAVSAFFQEQGLQPQRTPQAGGEWFAAGPYRVWCGDVFQLPAAVLQGCQAVYDRAALVALPPDLRARYVREVYGALPAGFRGLLVAIDYPQAQKDGPPFAVPDEEVQALFKGVATAALLRRENNLEPGGRFEQAGVSRLETLVYRLEG